MIEEQNFIGLSDGIPDLNASFYEDNTGKYLQFNENMEIATLKLNKEAIDFLRMVIESCS